MAVYNKRINKIMMKLLRSDVYTLDFSVSGHSNPKQCLTRLKICLICLLSHFDVLSGGWTHKYELTNFLGLALSLVHAFPFSKF